MSDLSALGAVNFDHAGAQELLHRLLSVGARLGGSTGVLDHALSVARPGWSGHTRNVVEEQLATNVARLRAIESSAIASRWAIESARAEAEALEVRRRQADHFRACAERGGA